MRPAWPRRHLVSDPDDGSAPWKSGAFTQYLVQLRKRIYLHGLDFHFLRKGIATVGQDAVSEERLTEIEPRSTARQAGAKQALVVVPERC